ncbi:hypothetical protein [Amycolatopsis solani]|uniref:hypothetical protein n=2 Tax=Amycolatopsis solani TaxID=3028615 RepID=UPI0025B0D4E5|nr:hypothetical protein [Amycolatopsis sp. MEP2-6]
MLASLLGIPAAVAAGYVPVKIFLDMPAEFSLGALPGLVLVDFAGYLVAGLVLLLGSLATLFRATAGAVLLGVGALLAIGALLMEPVSMGVPLARFADAMFTRGGLAMLDRVGLATLSVLVLVLAFLPPTFRYLRYRAALPALAGPGAYPTSSRTW